MAASVETNHLFNKPLGGVHGPLGVWGYLQAAAPSVQPCGVTHTGMFWWVSPKCTLNGRVCFVGRLRVCFFPATLAGYPTENVPVRGLHRPATQEPDSRLTAEQHSAQHTRVTQQP